MENYFRDAGSARVLESMGFRALATNVDEVLLVKRYPEKGQVIFV